jgi:hypothetical protein
MPRNDDDDDYRPRKRSRPRDDEDDDEPRARRRRRDEDEDDDEERPRSRRRVVDDDDEDRPRPKKRKKAKARAKEMSVVGIIGLVVGVVALLISIFMPCLASFALIPAGIGIVIGFIALVLAQKSDGRQGIGMPIAGLSVSAVAVLIAIGWLVLGKQIEKKFDKDFKEDMAQAAKKDAARQKESAKAAGEVKAAAAGGALKVTAVQFAKAYEGDEDQADRQYKNKVLEVTGTVQEVDFNRGEGDTYTVLLKAGPEDTVSCEFAKDPAVRARLVQLMPGQQVTIRGKCLGGSSTIEACVLVE